MTCSNFLCNNGDEAEVDKRRSHKAEVVGSSPIITTNFGPVLQEKSRSKRLAGKKPESGPRGRTKSMKKLWKKLLCSMDLHSSDPLLGNEDPFRGTPGHRHTVACLHCDKHRRVIAPIGDPTDDKLRVMPWVRLHK